MVNYKVGAIVPNKALMGGYTAQELERRRERANIERMNAHLKDEQLRQQAEIQRLQVRQAESLAGVLHGQGFRESVNYSLGRAYAACQVPRVNVIDENNIIESLQYEANEWLKDVEL